MTSRLVDPGIKVTVMPGSRCPPTERSDHFVPNSIKQNDDHPTHKKCLALPPIRLCTGLNLTASNPDLLFWLSLYEEPLYGRLPGEPTSADTKLLSKLRIMGVLHNMNQAIIFDGGVS